MKISKTLVLRNAENFMVNSPLGKVSVLPESKPSPQDKKEIEKYLDDAIMELASAWDAIEALKGMQGAIQREDWRQVFYQRIKAKQEEIRQIRDWIHRVLS